MLKHEHVLIRAEVRRPPTETRFIEQWISKLITDIGMKKAGIPGNPLAYYCDIEGNRGLTCVAVLETSHTALHSWDEGDIGVIHFDIYTCSTLDLKVAFDALAVFEPVKADYKFLDRDDGFRTLEEGTLAA